MGKQLDLDEVLHGLEPQVFQELPLLQNAKAGIWHGCSGMLLHGHVCFIVYIYPTNDGNLQGNHEECLQWIKLQLQPRSDVGCKLIGAINAFIS